MSQRSLQRKLAEQNTTYKQVLDGVRYDIAKSYLSESSHTATEITFLLGFSDLSAFTRAFKRWHGQSPSEFRAGLANRPIGA
jgi:AraC-like DNA-binding protein